MDLLSTVLVRTTDLGIALSLLVLRGQWPNARRMKVNEVMSLFKKLRDNLEKPDM